eukprot:CAMPEP_0182832920 /NCGR_PEP_ID=MMETSP0006_2-20121128/19990_1 /TAXON_ID=97485 /ORGANISM="Prymnesium parvum, Strain Texoma1" /LENGTH=37 /DNA_ID= /DNA_START= /DNA_END= /DNA_ORIENTATION=
MTHRRVTRALAKSLLAVTKREVLGATDEFAHVGSPAV